MPNYKRGFKLLSNRIGLVRQHFDTYTYQNEDCSEASWLEFYGNEIKIMRECYDHCEEVDNLNKIIEEFKKLGYVKVAEKNDIYHYISFEDRKNELEIFDDPMADIYYIKSAHWTFNPTMLTKEEFKLVIRILRLWGVEV